MFRQLKFLAIALVSLISCFSQTKSLQAEEYVYGSPANEVEAAVLTLQDMKYNEDREFVRFFSTYAMPKELQEKAAYILSFVCHTLVGPPVDDFDNANSYYPLAIKNEDGKFVAIQRSKYSDTLYWIDLREFNWTEEAWEKLSLEDGYFVEPIVEHFSNSALRLIAGNAIVRADWFIVHATDLTAESDRGSKTQIFYELLYAKNKIPKNLDEWFKIWGVNNLDKSRTLGNEAGALVLKSAVSRNNRFVFSYRTELGWLYHTYDVLNHTGERDYLETFPALEGKPPKLSDGGEGFSFNGLGMLTGYMIRNANDEFVDFGDPTLVHNLTDINSDPRVRTAASCIDCHAAGPIEPRNIISEYIKQNAKLKVYDYSSKLRIERTYLSNKIEDAVTDGKELFARSLKRVNGLTPEENGKAYLEILAWYKKPLDLKQVLIECGVSQKDFEDRIKRTNEVYGKNKVPPRLAVLLAVGESIPRDIWENPGRDGIPGTFQQTMVSLYGLTAIIEDYIPVKIAEKQVNTDNQLYLYTTVEWCNIYSSGQPFARLPRGTKLTYLGVVSKDNDWIGVSYNNKSGWVLKSEVRK